MMNTAAVVPFRVTVPAMPLSSEATDNEDEQVRSAPLPDRLEVALLAALPSGARLIRWAVVSATPQWWICEGACLTDQPDLLPNA